MIHIIDLQPLPNAQLLLRFDDGTDKVVDIKLFIGSDALTAPLADLAFFQQAALYPNGRGIFWPNDYDMCPDYLRYHAVDARAGQPA
ncbi:DUF2442 domain-containing protein [uncultured Hymenobacter sp.]|uniref:DUF2442 domain-containing protein n=1 Tax=uncultured Hymenobacter sp. TaxID=170016 RepID=UPI0035CA9086